jgi:hypothetical protein
LELALPIVYCPGIYVLCIVLLQIANDSTIKPTIDSNGYFGLVFGMMRDICVSVSGGPHFRAQVSVSKSDIGRAVVDADLCYLRSLCLCSQTTEHRQSDKQLNEEYTKLVKQNVAQAGDLNGQHLVHLLALLGLLKPVGVLRHCRMAQTSSKNKKPNSNRRTTTASRVPMLQHFLHAGQSDSAETKLRSVLDAVRLHAIYKYPELSGDMWESVIEAIGCEHNRQRTVFDFVFPLPKFLSLEPDNTLLGFSPVSDRQDSGIVMEANGIVMEA